MAKSRVEAACPVSPRPSACTGYARVTPLTGAGPPEWSIEPALSSARMMDGSRDVRTGMPRLSDGSASRSHGRPHERHLTKQITRYRPPGKSGMGVERRGG